jgi:hypothetical protein
MQKYILSVVILIVIFGVWPHKTHAQETKRAYIWAVENIRTDKGMAKMYSPVFAVTVPVSTGNLSWEDYTKNAVDALSKKMRNFAMGEMGLKWEYSSPIIRWYFDNRNEAEESRSKQIAESRRYGFEILYPWDTFRFSWDWQRDE